jgi:hypothetical protein
LVKPESDSRVVQADALSMSERILLFCVGSQTSWERTAITRATVTSLIITGLIQCDPAGMLRLTKEGRASLLTMLGEVTPAAPP